MSDTTVFDTGAPTIEVRIYSGERLLVRELCESEEEAAAVVDRWSDVENLYVVVDDIGTPHSPGDVLEPEPPIVDVDEDDR